ncbi:MAG: hypothetical protein Q4D56_06310 [Bacteroides sp.]|nr:hypothetical protein [Bacteroides sp.]
MEPLTIREQQVLDLCIANAEWYGEEGGFCYEETAYNTLGLTLQQLKGYIGQLVKKGYLLTCEDCYFSHVVKSLRN